ncbi:MAG: hypothetical protein M3Y45_09815 [Actinomycetota bacterium]|nr:hypothetical protein [Actinomycetota bacterium]
MSFSGGRGHTGVRAPDGRLVDRGIRLAGEHPVLLGVAVTGWILALALLNAYYIVAMSPIGSAAVFWSFSLVWLSAGLIVGRFWALFLALLPVFVLWVLGTTPLYGSVDMPQWFYALFPAVIVYLPATFAGVIIHKWVADLRCG